MSLPTISNGRILFSKKDTDMWLAKVLSCRTCPLAFDCTGLTKQGSDIIADITDKITNELTDNEIKNKANCLRGREM